MNYSDETKTTRLDGTEYTSRARRPAADEAVAEDGARSLRKPALHAPDAEHLSDSAPNAAIRDGAYNARRRARNSSPVRADGGAERPERVPERRHAARYEDGYGDDGRSDINGGHALARRGEAYASDYEYAEAERPPRNRFMAWLESLRIIEEVPEDEYADYGDERGADYAESADAPAEQTPADEDVRRTERNPRAALGRRQERRNPEAPAPEADDGREDGEAQPRARRIAVPVPKGRQRKSSAAAEADMPEYAGPSAAALPAYAEENRAYIAKDAAAPEAIIAAPEADDGAEPTDLDAPPVSRRARRRRVESEARQAAEPSEAVHPSDTVRNDEVAVRDSDDTPEAEYVKADLNGKRDILYEHWREQFTKNLVIPAKPEKMRLISDMVRKILNACPDESSLNMRWDKLEKMLDGYSSAVVAEYGYKDMLQEVQNDERQRMYGRPSDEITAKDAEEPHADAPTEGAAASAEGAATPTLSHAAVEPDYSEGRNASGAFERGNAAEQYNMDAREDEYIDDERRAGKDAERYADSNEWSRSPRMRRSYTSGMAERPAQRKDGKVSRFFSSMAQKFGGYDDSEASYEGGAYDDRSVRSRFRQLFHRGDVLDYSSNDAEYEHDNEPYEDVPERQGGFRKQSSASGYESQSDGGDGRDAGRADNAVAPYRDTVRKFEYAAPEMRPTDAQVPQNEAERPQTDADCGYQGAERPAYDYGRAENDGYNPPQPADIAPQSGYADGYARQKAPEYAQPDTPDTYGGIYDENNADYSAERPDYSKDYSDNEFEDSGAPYTSNIDDYASDGYVRSADAENNYSRGGYDDFDGYTRMNMRRYDADHMRGGADGGIQRGYGEREYHSRPQSGEASKRSDDAEDRWRSRSPTRDDRGELGAPHEATKAELKGCNAPVSKRHLRTSALLGRLLFTTAYACADADDAEKTGAETPEHRASASQRESAGKNAAYAELPPAGRARLQLGGKFGGRHSWLGTALAVLGIAGAFALACMARVAYDVLEYKSGFYEGLYLDGIALAGMSVDEAVSAVNDANADRVNSIRLSIEYDDRVYELDSGGLGVRLNTRDLLDEMWQLGRRGSYRERYAAITALRTDNVFRHTDLSYDRAALDGFLSGVKADVDELPRDAVIEFSPAKSEKFRIYKGSAGREVDISALKADAEALIEAGGGSLKLAPKKLMPAFDSDMARKCTGKLVTYTTDIRSKNSARTSNIKRALDFYNGLRVESGQQIDFNKLVGRRTEERGFKPAPEYANGDIVEGVGGGVCQASTTLYGAVLRAGMRVDARYNHSMTVGYVPRSQDAAVVYPGKTLSFTNTLGYPAFFETSVTPEKSTVTIYGYDVYPEETISIESEILAVDKAKVKILPDPNYRYTSAAGEEKLVTTPSDGVTSRAYRIRRDDATGRTISRELISRDVYIRRDGVKYRGGEQ